MMQQQNYLQGLVVPLQLSTQPLQFAAGQHGPAVLALQLILLLHHLKQLLLQNLQLLLVAPMLLQLQKWDILIVIDDCAQEDISCFGEKQYFLLYFFS